MKKLFLTLSLLFAAPSLSSDLRQYAILRTNESKLVLQDLRDERVYIVEARIYCWEHHGFGEDAVVLSTKNLAVCGGSATLISARGETCDVWCP